jgi:C1A family cysteine protease
MDPKNYLLNVRPSPADARDYRASAIYPIISLPAELDLRPKLQPIRDQGSQGACAAMAGAAMKECQEFTDSLLNEYFSPQFIYNLRDGDGDGMYMRDLMNILRKTGDCTEKAFPYGSVGKPPQNALNEAKSYIIQSYASISTVEELKTALYLNGVCIIAVPVYNFTERMWYQNPGEEYLGGHSMAIVGYNKDGFIIRNSWSETWGDKGYCVMPYADLPLAWEVWSTVDDRSTPPEPEPKRRGCLARIFGL